MIFKLCINVFYVCVFVSFVYICIFRSLTCVSCALFVDVGLCMFFLLRSGGHEHAVVPGYGSYAAVSAAFPAGCHPEKENRTDLGKHPACSGSTHLAAVP